LAPSSTLSIRTPPPSPTRRLGRSSGTWYAARVRVRVRVWVRVGVGVGVGVRARVRVRVRVRAGVRVRVRVRVRVGQIFWKIGRPVYTALYP
jgi:hypothetical protein